MKHIERVYISGLGAVGGAYAGKLYEMNSDCVKVIVNKERMELYKKNVFRINNTPYNFEYVLPEDIDVPADLVIIAVKQHHLKQAIQDIKGAIGSNTIILSLLNGIISEEQLAEVYGADKLLYSFCVGTDSVRELTNVHYTNLGKIVFGQKDNSTNSENVAAVEALFQKAGIPYEIPRDILRELWWKFMLNVGINQTSAVLRASYGVFQRNEEAIELMVMASKEVVEIAAKLGISLSEADIDKYIKVIKALAPNGKTSMLQDVEASRKTEVELFSGTVIELGKKLGIKTPVNEILNKMIKVIEREAQV